MMMMMMMIVMMMIVTVRALADKSDNFIIFADANRCLLVILEPICLIANLGIGSSLILVVMVFSDGVMPPDAVANGLLHVERQADGW